MTTTSGPSAPPRARAIAVPAPARAVQTLSSFDYEDACAVALPASLETLTVEEWSRIVFEQAGAIAPALYAIWSLLCRLDLGARGSRQHVLGWEIAAAAPASLLLDAESGGVHAQLVISVQPSQLGLATFTRYKDTGGRLLFSAIAPIHRRVAPFLLTRGVARANARPAAA